MGNDEWNINSTFGERLEDLIKEKGVKYQEVGDAIGVNKSQISKWCSGNCDAPGAKKIIALAKYFRVTSDYLLGLSNVKANQNIEIDQLGLNAEAIEWLKLLYTSANDPYNKKQEIAQQYIESINKLLEICFTPTQEYGWFDFLNSFYSSFFYSIGDLILPDGTKYHESPDIDRLHEKAINRTISEKGVDWSTEETEHYKRLAKRQHKGNEYLFEINNSGIRKNVFILNPDIHLRGVLFENFIRLLRDIYSKVMEQDENFFDVAKNKRAKIKRDFIEEIKIANKHDSSMTPEQWFDFLYEKNEIDYNQTNNETGDPDGNDK